MSGSWKQLVKIGILTSMVIVTGMALLPHKASAQYVEGNLIDDNLFLDAASMSQSSIQSFLSGRGGYIANYYSWSGRDNANVSAARIIADAAYDYGISPKVILATLQKEQSLVTAKNPTSSQLNFAMGYGCPDSTGCGTSYSGFYSQVDNATWQLRYNMERARGNNTWWRNSSTYPCGSPTRYYSNGLYMGNWVTFYDDAGTAYKSFKLNDAATASLYCYTPHAYPGSAAHYYSGSYNFVSAYESWFGSTQPAVLITSPLQVTSGTPGGMYTGTPVTVSFTLVNNANWPVGIGQMGVAVRDQNGNNYDYALQPVTIPAYGSYRYTATQTFNTEGTYTFFITNYNGGSWSQSEPPSSSIDNPRQVVTSMQAMPTITAGPASSVTDMRQGKATQLSFSVKNNSAQSMNVGKLAIQIRGPSGQNLDAPLQSFNLAAGATQQYTANFTPPVSGSYFMNVTSTRDNGATWNEQTYPQAVAGQQRSLTVNTGPSPTLTQGPAINVGSPHIGDTATASFKVKNYGDAAVNAGHIGLAMRDPLGRNVDPGSVDLTVNANSEYTFQANTAFQTPGTYTAWVTATRDGGRTWDDTSYPTVDSDSVNRKVTFTVAPNPLVTVEPTITTTNPRVGALSTASFTLHNYSNQSVSLNGLALAARDPNGANVDFSLQRNITIAAGSDYAYTATNHFTTAGTYSAHIVYTPDGGKTWDDTSYPAAASDSIHRFFSFTVNPSPTLTQGPQLSIASPHVGEQVTTSFKVKNYGDSAVNVGHIGLAIRDPQGRNVDPGSVDLTVNAGTEYTFSANAAFQTPGTYTAWVTVTRDGGKTWDDTSYPAADSGSVTRKVTFTVQP